MKSISSTDNTYYSFTDNQTAIEVVWEFDETNFVWKIIAIKDNEKEFIVIPASSRPTEDGLNKYDFERISENTIKLVEFLAKRLKLDAKISDK